MFLIITFRTIIGNGVFVVEDKYLKKLLKICFRNGKHVLDGCKEFTMTIGSNNESRIEVVDDM
jgi:hypothetical protein